MPQCIFEALVVRLEANIIQEVRLEPEAAIEFLDSERAVTAALRSDSFTRLICVERWPGEVEQLKTIDRRMRRLVVSHRGACRLTYTYGASSPEHFSISRRSILPISA